MEELEITIGNNSAQPTPITTLDNRISYCNAYMEFQGAQMHISKEKLFRLGIQHLG